MIYSGSSNVPLAEKIANQLNLSLSSLEIHVFPDGEKRVRVLDRVLDKETIVVQSVSRPVDQNYMELFFIIDALKRSGAGKVTSVLPYLGYQRQDHVFRGGEAVSLEVIAKFLNVLKVDRIITFDLHSIKIPEFFNVPVDHLSALPLFAQKIREMLLTGHLSHVANDVRRAQFENPTLSSSSLNEHRSLESKDKSLSPGQSMFSSFANEQLSSWGREVVLISPDMGGVRRIKILSELLDNMPYLAIEKERDLETGTVKANKLVGFSHSGEQSDSRISEGSWSSSPRLLASSSTHRSGSYGEAGQDDKEIEGKTAIVVDDMISSGETIAVASLFLLERGVKEVYVFATHPVFSDQAAKVLSEQNIIKKVFVTDSVYVPKDRQFEKLEVLSIAEMIADQLKVKS